MAAPKIYDASFTKIVEVSPTTKHFEITLPEPVDYKPGQFVMVKVIPGEGQKEIRRPYSICSVPDGSNKVEIVLNRVPGGFMSNYLNDLPEGSPVKVQLPFGQFTLKEPLEDFLFVATGTGIAPFRSQIKWLLEVQKHTRPIGLAFGFRYKDEYLYKEEFEELAKKYSNFRFYPICSRCGECEWGGERGHVQAIIKKYFATPIQGHVFFCGVPAMIDETKKILGELGYDPKKLHEEKY